MLIGSAVSATHKFRENILESSRNVSEPTPRHQPIVRAHDDQYIGCRMTSLDPKLVKCGSQSDAVNVQSI